MDFLKIKSIEIQNFLEKNFIVDGEILHPPENFKACTSYFDNHTENNVFEIIMKKIIKPFFGKDKVTPICIKLLHYMQSTHRFDNFKECFAFIYSELETLLPFIKYYKDSFLDFFIRCVVTDENALVSLEIIKEVILPGEKINFSYYITIISRNLSSGLIEMLCNSNYEVSIPFDDLFVRLKEKYFISSSENLKIINSIQKNISIEMSISQRNFFRHGRVLSRIKRGVYGCVTLNEETNLFEFHYEDVFLELNEEEFLTFIFD